MKKATAIKRFLLALLVLVLLAGLVAIFLPSGGESIGHTVTFSDGTTMTLKAVTYGTQHQYLGGGWQQRVLSLLPRKLAAKLASQQGVLTMGRPSVAFWFERIGTGPTTGAPQLVLFDANDFGVCGSSPVMRMGTGANWIEGWAFDFWPRRERTFTLRVYEQGTQDPDANPIGEFTVRNPTPGNHPEWTAPEPPVTAREGDLAVTLFDLTAGVDLRSYQRKPAPNPTVSMTRAGFRVERNGRPTKEWELDSVEASDATGNVIADIWGKGPGLDSEFVRLKHHLWPAEQAWKLRVGFSQRSNFVASELWTLHGVPLPETDLTKTVVTQTNLQGALLQYTGESRRYVLSGDHHFDYRVNFRVTPSRPDYRMTLVRAVDDNGREAPVGRSFESPGEWDFGLRVNTNATSLDLTLALHQTRYVEFLARPRIISTNDAARGERRPSSTSGFARTSTGDSSAFSRREIR
ncbi:MAG TPA: hypothetical protein VFT34_00790 [Verrucomicrobiae bacterium]|nr:hypothetical protein [Verrucomicrobiae bacterium]